MSTDPFKDVSSVNRQISKPSFVELIYVNQIEEKSTLGKIPNVESSLRNIAFKKGIRKIEEPPEDAPELVYREGSLSVISSYFPTLVAQSDNNLKEYRMKQEFNSLISNTIYSVNCVSDSTMCPGDSACMIDMVFVRDIFDRNYLYNNDIINIIDKVTELTNGNCRFSVIFNKLNDPNIFPELKFNSEPNQCNNGPNAKSVHIRSHPGNSYNNDFADITISLFAGILNGTRAGAYRSDPRVKKIVIWETRDYTNSGLRSSYGWNSSFSATIEQIATNCAGCGVQVCMVFSPESGTDNIYKDAKTFQDITGGKYAILEDRNISTNPLQLYNQLFNYLEDLCFIPPSQCVFSDNLLLNPSFEDGLAGWNIINNNASQPPLSSGVSIIFNREIDLEQGFEGAVWNKIGKSAKFIWVDALSIDDDGVGIYQNFYYKLNEFFSNNIIFKPGSYKLILKLDYMLSIPNGSTTTPIIVCVDLFKPVIFPIPRSFPYEPTAKITAYNSQIKSTIYVETVINDLFTLNNSNVMIYINDNFNTANEKCVLIIDNLQLCVEPINDSCGPGKINLIQNGDFDTGVEYWTDHNNIALTNTNYDSQNKALILNNTDLKTALVSDDISTIRFTIFETDNDCVGINPVGPAVNINFEDDTGNPAVGTITGITPSQIPYDFNIDVKELVSVWKSENPTKQLKKIRISGTNICLPTKLKNINICSNSKCLPGFTLLNDSDFNSDNNGWAPGATINGNLVLTGNLQSDTNSYAQQIFTAPADSIIYINLSRVTNAYDIRQIPLLIQIINSASINSVSNFTYIMSDNEETALVQSEVGSSGTVIIKLTPINPSLAPNKFVSIRNITVCYKEQKICKGKVKNLQLIITSNGIPRLPVNLFNLFARITTRNVDDVYSRITVNVPIKIEGRSSYNSCNRWVRNNRNTITTNPVMAYDLSDSKMLIIRGGDESDISQRQDFYWNIPFSETATAAEQLILRFGEIEYGPIVESIEIYYLANVADPGSNNTEPVKAGPFITEPDPSSSISFNLKYETSDGFKSFLEEVEINKLLVQEVDFTQYLPDKWDTIIPNSSNGLKGSTARWEVVKFDIDLPTGNGLDQCSTPIKFLSSGTGNLTFSPARLSNNGTFFDPCDAEVEVMEVQKGSVESEIQSIALPGPTGGTWVLSIEIQGITRSVILPYNVTNSDLQNALEQLENIGEDNVIVIGKGTSYEPFLINFTNLLAGRPIGLINANGTNLIGSAPGVVSTIQTGTINERQIIRTTPGTLNDFVVEFNGASSLPIRYNAPINEKRAIIEAIPTIGQGNVTVTGWIEDHTLPYTGDIIVDFTSQYPYPLGPLANTNVPEMIVTPSPPYNVQTMWNGVTGINELQHIKIFASGGTYKLKIFDPADINNEVFTITGAIPYNATASQLKNAMLAATFLTSNDITVTELPPQSVATGIEFYGYAVEFVGNLAKTNINQIMIDTSDLIGGVIQVKQVQSGGVVYGRQKIKIVKANGGYFRLLINVNGLEEWSDPIVHDTTAEGLQEIITAHPFLSPEEVVVTKLNNNDPNITAIFQVTFKQLGNIPIMEADFGTTLLCNPLNLTPTIAPPYPYPIPLLCSIDEGCSTNLTINKPCIGDEIEEVALCCNNEKIRPTANISRRIKYEKDLFDPNGDNKTIRSIISSKGLVTSKYNIFKYDTFSNRYVEVDGNINIIPGMKIIIINKEISNSRYNSIFSRVNK